MNSDKMMAAIGGISDQYIEKYAVVKPIRQISHNRNAKRLKRTYNFRARFVTIAILVGIVFAKPIKTVSHLPVILLENTHASK